MVVQWLKFYNVVCELTNVHLFKSVRILLENFVKRDYKRLNKYPCAAIRDVRMFEVLNVAKAYKAVFKLKLKKWLYPCGSYFKIN